MCPCVWRPEVTAGAFLSHCLAYFWRQDSSLNIRLTDSTKPAGQQGSGILWSLGLGLQVCPTASGFDMAVWDWTQVFMFAWEVFSWLFHLPSPPHQIYTAAESHKQCWDLIGHNTVNVHLCKTWKWAFQKWIFNCIWNCRKWWGVYDQLILDTLTTARCTFSFFFPCVLENTKWKKKKKWKQHPCGPLSSSPFSQQMSISWT